MIEGDETRDEVNQRLNIFEDSIHEIIRDNKHSYQLLSNKIDTITANQNDGSNEYIEHSLKKLNKRIDTISESYITDIK